MPRNMEQQEQRHKRAQEYLGYCECLVWLRDRNKQPKWERDRRKKGKRKRVNFTVGFGKTHMKVKILTPG